MNTMCIKIKLKKTIEAAIMICLSVMMTYILTGCSAIQNRIFKTGICFERFSSSLKFNTIQAFDHKIAYLERNSDQPQPETIVLLHGFAADKDHWDRFVFYIPKKYRVLLLDMPGHGDSIFFMDKTYDVQHISQIIHIALENLKLKRFHLVGNSLGGEVATYYAFMYPSEIITLGLFDSGGVSTFAFDPNKEKNPLLITDKEDFERLMKFTFVKQPFIPEPVRAVLSRELIKKEAFSQKLFNDIMANRIDFISLLPRLFIPVFVLWGEKDNIIPPSCVEVYKRYLPNVKTVILENCGHLPMLEQPSVTAEKYMKFINLKFK